MADDTTRSSASSITEDRSSAAVNEETLVASEDTTDSALGNVTDQTATGVDVTSSTEESNSTEVWNR